MKFQPARVNPRAPVLWRAVAAMAMAERDRWLLWIPVALGAGIGLYFSLPFEPEGSVGAIWLGVFLAAALACRRIPRLGVVFGLAGLAALGFTAAQFRTQSVGAPVIAKRTGPITIEGRLAGSVKLASGGMRLVIEEPRPATAGRGQTWPFPKRIRLTARAGGDAVVPGDIIRVPAVILPPPDPVAPGAFDFGRQIFFQGIGGVGYTVGKVRLAPPGEGAATARAESGWFDDLRYGVAATRQGLAERIRQGLPGPSGTVAAALMTGDRKAIPDSTVQALRDAGLAHLLAISGLHMGLLAGLLFFAVRSLLAAFEWSALFLPTKKLAAVAALFGALAYLILTGASVSTQRAFIMTAIVLLAVLVDRSAISMRLVAWAAGIILLMAPESLWQAGFQMSFAAVIALIAVYETVRDAARNRPLRRTLAAKVRFYVAGVLLTSLVAGLATAPFAAFHFNRFVDYGLVANLVAVPVMALWIMPWAMVVFVAMPLGWESLPLRPMGWGIDVVIGVSETVAGWPGAVTLVPAAPLWALAAIVLGGLWLCLWRQPWRWAGLCGVGLGLAIWAMAPRPDILIDRDGLIFGVRGQDGGLRVSSKRVARFTRKIWLRRDALEGASPWSDSEPQENNANRLLSCDSLGCLYRPAPGILVALVQRAEAVAEDCARARVVVALVPVRGGCDGAQVVIDRFDLWRNGAHAVWIDGAAIRVEHAAGQRGDRPWVARKAAR